MSAARGKKVVQKTELDFILDQALDDFEEQEIKSKASAVVASGSPDDEAPDTALLAEQEKAAELENMRKLLSQLDDPSFGSTLKKTLQSLNSTSDGVQNVDDLLEQLAQQFQTANVPSIVPNNPDDPSISHTDRRVAGALQMMGNAQEGMEAMEPSRLEEVGETMMQDMMSQFEALGEKEDYNEVIDGVMRQLLSRDLMYEPVKQVCEKFPEWLALQRRNMSDTDYVNYGRQYQVFQKLLAVYDSEPENFPRLMELMFEMQEYGQPPAEIIKGLAPGLLFDENGMPVMPNMGVGAMPEGLGAGGLPNMAEMAGNMGGGQCSIM